jgi:8-hydroxy-5-deazaflavin:NADPH oxidoreductase
VHSAGDRLRRLAADTGVGQEPDARPHLSLFDHDRVGPVDTPHAERAVLERRVASRGLELGWLADVSIGGQDSYGAHRRLPSASCARRAVCEQDSPGGIHGAAASGGRAAGALRIRAGERRGPSRRLDLDVEGHMAGNETVDHGRRHLLQLAGGGLGWAVLGPGPARAWAQTTPASPLKIGSVGAGRMGGALGALFIKAGYPVMFSSRHPEHLKAMAARLGPLAQAGTVEQAIAFGDVVVMVVPYAALEEIGQTHGRALASKPLVLDICNPIARRDGEAIVQWVTEQGGAGLASATLLPGARIVRAFNALSYRKLADDAHRPGGPVGVPIAGDDQTAIALAEGIIRTIGFEPVLVGGLARGKYLLPGTPLAEEHTPEELRKIAAGLQ